MTGLFIYLKLRRLSNMAMQKIAKKQEEPKVTEIKAPEIEEKVLQAVDEVAENDKPFLKQETTGDVVVLGDARKVEKVVNETTYKVDFLFEKAKFNIEDYGNVSYENKDFFVVTADATQEPVTPYNRTFLATVAFDFIRLFFEFNDGVAELITDEKKLTTQTLSFYRASELVKGMKDFVGILLGLDEELIPYQNDVQLLANAINLIEMNPTLINEVYFQVK